MTRLYTAIRATFRTLLALAIGATALCPIFSQAAESPVLSINAAAAKGPIKVDTLRGNISVLLGSGGNITVLDSPEGKFVVDAGIGVSKAMLRAAFNTISASPPRFLINTHWHWDHTDGNVWMHEDGATILATEKVLTRLTRTERVEDWNFTFKPLARGGLPTVLIKHDETRAFAGEKIRLTNVKDGHTDSDTVVYFQNADVLVLGDVFWNSVYPFIDNGVGGSVEHMITEVNRALKLSTDKTIIVPGHGEVGNRADLTDFRDMLVAISDNVKQLKQAGKTLAQIVAAKPTAAYDKKYGGFVIQPDLFTRLVYDGLK